jgi:hypothetical protein
MPAQLCQKLKEHNAELVAEAPKAAALQAEQEKELRKLLTQAQQDVEKHRQYAAEAMHEKQAVCKQVWPARTNTDAPLRPRGPAALQSVC